MAFTRDNLSDVLLNVKTATVNGNTANIETDIARMHIRYERGDNTFNPTEEQINRHKDLYNHAIKGLITGALMEVGQKVARNPTPTAKLDADLACSAVIQKALQEYYLHVMNF